jgi:hypothetical protein
LFDLVCCRVCILLQPFYHTAELDADISAQC